MTPDVAAYLRIASKTSILYATVIHDLTTSFGLTPQEAGQAIADAAEIAAQQKELRELSAEHRKQKQQGDVTELRK